MSEFGVQRPSPCFVRPLCAGRLLDSPIHAAHFVSLLNFERGNGDEVWHSLQARPRPRPPEPHRHLPRRMASGPHPLRPPPPPPS